MCFYFFSTIYYKSYNLKRNIFQNSFYIMSQKKKLLLIGNGPIPIDISEKVNEFDYVFRVNRMTNFPTTGTRIDGVFIGAYKDFRTIYKGGEFKDYFKTAKQVFLTQELKKWFKDWDEYLTQEQWDNVQIMDFSHNMENIGSKFPTTTLCVLNVLTSFPEWYENYEIWVCGITVEGRSELMYNGQPWIKTLHRFDGEKEEIFLKKLLNENKIKRLIPEIDDCIYNCEG